MGVMRIFRATTPLEEGQILQKDRQNWTSRAEFLLSSLGYAVGLGNVWRFPYLCYKNGGGSFFIPYTLSLFMVGIPLFMAEMTIGQYGRSGPLHCWHFAPLFRGVGFGMCLISSFIAMYYNILITWAFYYFFASMSTELPWKNCGGWSTIHCKGKIDKVDAENCTLLSGGIVNEDAGVCLNSSNKNATIGYFYDNFTTLPAEEYLSYVSLRSGLSPGIHDIGSPKWDLVLCYLLSWLIVIGALIKGIKSLGKVVYFTATFPYLMLLILLCYGLSLDGAGEGIRFYLEPRPGYLSNSMVWKDAITQIFFSLGVGWGGVISLASFNKFDANLVHDTLIITLGNCATSVFAGFVIFSYLGHFAHASGQAVSEVAKGGVTLAFVIYPQALSTLPQSIFMALCFFAMLCTLGFDSQFTLVETVLISICELFNIRGMKKVFLLIGIATLFFIIGLCMTTPGGVYVLTLMDDYGGAWNVMLQSLFVCAALGIYGPLRFTNDIQTIVGTTVVKCIPWKYFKWYFIACWTVLTPCVLVTIIFFSWRIYKPGQYGSVYLTWPLLVGWMITLSVVASIFICMAIDIMNAPGANLKEKVKYLLTPNKLWRPPSDKSDVKEITAQNVSPAEEPVSPASP